MVTLTEIECEDGSCTVDISNKCGPRDGGDDLGMVVLKVVGCYDGGDDVSYGDFLGEVVGDDQMSFQSGENIAESSELENDWIVNGSTILKTILGVSNGDVEKVNGFENMCLLLKDTESVGTDVEVKRVMEIVEVIEDDEKSETVILENNDGVLSPEVNATPLVNETEPPLEDGDDETKDEFTEISFATESVHFEDQNGEVILEKDIGYNIVVEICDDDEQTGYEVKEDDDTNQVIFPEFNIQFGSFGLTDDTKSEPKSSNSVTKAEPECGVNINNHEQNIIDLLDDIIAGQEDSQRLEFPFNVQIREDELPPYRALEEIQLYEDGKLVKQIVNARLQIEENIRCRDAIMAESRIKWKNMIDHNEALNAKNLELRAARQLVISTRQQIDHVQRIDDRIKNAMVVKDLDSRINKAEDIIKQGTLSFEDEKQFSSEIKQLKSLRAILASNMIHTNDISSMLNQKDQIKELLESLKMDLKIWKDKLSKVQVACITLRRKYVEQLEMEKDLQAQLVIAEKSLQEAEAHLLSLEEQFSTKNKISYMYQDEPMVARKLESPTDECLSVLTNEPSHDYLDESSLSLPDEPFCMVPDDVEEEIVNNLNSTPYEAKYESVGTNLEAEKPVKFVKENQVKDQNKKNVLEVFEQAMKNEEKCIERVEILNIEEKEKIDKLMKEETKLKERILLEENIKAIEARKQNAQKAQTEAQILALKEAQKRENMRLKRLRKRERKRATKDAASTTIGDEGVAGSKETEGKPLAPPPFLPNQVKPKAITSIKPWWNWRNFVIWL